MKTTVLLYLIILTECILAKMELKHVHVFFRHGSRVPDLHELYPNDPHNKLITEMGLGELTREGKCISCKLGKQLREHYKVFLGDIPNPGVIRSQSTNSPRTILTTTLVLNGLFNQTCDDSPIRHDDVIIKPYELSLAAGYCPTYSKELENFLITDKIKKILKRKQEFFEYLTTNAGRNYTTFKEVLFLYETLAAEKSLNLTLPQWAESVYNDIKNLAVLRLKYESGNEILKRLNGGRMLRKVVDNMEKKINNAPEYDNVDMNLYSCHDFNIAGILSTLNTFKPHFPKYNSAIAFELYHNDKPKQHYVKLVYFKGNNVGPKVLRIPSCTRFCEYSKFKRRLNPYLPGNYTNECDSKVLLD